MQDREKKEEHREKNIGQEGRNGKVTEGSYEDK